MTRSSSGHLKSRLQLVCIMKIVVNALEWLILVHRCRKADGDGKDEFCIIPQEIAVFEGNKNHTSTGSKLGIESLIERNENDLVHLLQPALQLKQRLQIVTQKQSHKQYDKAQCHGNDTQQQKLRLHMEKACCFLCIYIETGHTPKVAGLGIIILLKLSTLKLQYHHK